MPPNYTSKQVNRFWSKVDQSGGVDSCWNWTASLRNTYGQFSINGKPNYAHRLAYELTHGAIPSTLDILHSCDNRKCCNPAHLFPGTNLDNMRDKVKKGRQAKGESSGTAKITAAQVQSIRARYATGGISQEKLGNEYGLHQTHIGRIVRGKNWL